MIFKPPFLDWLLRFMDKERSHSRLTILIVSLVSTCPVILVAVVSYLKTSEELTASELSRKQATVTLAAATIEEKLNRLTDLGVSLATRVRFRQLVEAGKWQEAITIVEAVPKNFPFVERLFIADVGGSLMADTPELPGVRGTNFAHRDWYKGVTATRKPFVSEVYQRTAKPQHHVIAQATPITNDRGDIIGILTLQVRTATFLAWIRSIDTGAHGFLFIVDRYGKTVAHPQWAADTKIVDYAKLPPVREALQGRRGVETDINGGDEAEQVVAYQPIPGYGWAVIFQQAQASAFALRDNSLSRLLMAYFFVGLATGCIVYLILRALNSRRRGEQKFRELVESAPDGLVMADTDGRIILVNAQVEQLFGYTRQELLGKPVELLMPSRFRPQHPGHREAFLHDAKPRSMAAGRELFGLRKDGGEFPIAVSLSPLQTEEGMRVISSIRDVTDRKRLGEQLRSKNELLEAQNHEVQQANRLKSEFLANMSHELRTPLNAIIGFAQLMHDGKVGPIAADHQEYLGDILGSAKHLLQLINDVLDLAKVEAGKMEFSPEPVSLTKIIGEVRQVLQALSASKRLAVEVEVSPAVERLIIDPAKLKQILYNYLSNAIKFTPAEGRIKVHALAEGADNFRLEVEDTGIGIVADDIDKLFAEFCQLESATTKKHQGTGLGLALTKKIVQAQGGDVGVRSTPDQGSVFYAVLPRIAEPTKTIAPVQLPIARDKNGPAVLVVEDNEMDRAWLVRILSAAGYCVDSAKTGAEALTMIEAETYRAILLDMILPDMIGWDVLHSTRQTGRNQNVPVIVLSVINEREVAKGFPVQDYLAKPVSAEKLIQSLHRAEIRPNGHAKRILIIDDDPKILKIGSAALRSAGYEAVCYINAAEGLLAANAAEFDAVVLDLLMPGIDGFEFLDRFREISGCRNTPVIIWTNKDITAKDRDRLKHSAQLITSKATVGVDAVLRELQLYVGATSEILDSRL